MREINKKGIARWLKSLPAGSSSPATKFKIIFRRWQPFRVYLESLNQEFAEHLAQKFSERTARKHAGIVDLFIEFVVAQTDVASIEDITRGVANTHFRQWYKRKVWDSATDTDLKVALRKFFTFLSEEKDITNEKVLKSLQ